MSIDHRFLRTHPNEDADQLYQKAQQALKTLPLIRLAASSQCDDDDDDDWGVAESLTPAEEALIPKNEIFELAHYSDKRQLKELRAGSSASWADYLGISDHWIRKYTGTQNPGAYRSLYLIRVHARAGQMKKMEWESNKTASPVAYEYHIKFKVLYGQFAEIPVNFDHTVGKMI